MSLFRPARPRPFSLTTSLANRRREHLRRGTFLDATNHARRHSEARRGKGRGSLTATVVLLLVLLLVLTYLLGG